VLQRNATARSDTPNRIFGASTIATSHLALDRRPPADCVLTRARDLGLELESVTVFDAERERSVVGRDISATKPGCDTPIAGVSSKRNKLEGGLR
jgi:hypothetical protein